MVAALAGGCGSNDEEPAVLPPATASPSPSPTTTKGLYDKQQVKYVYKKVVAAYGKAERMPAGKRREFLSQWMVDPALSQFVDGMAREDRKHHRTFGKSMPHIFNVTIDGKQAHVDDCSDDSALTLKNTKTGKVIQQGQPHIWLVAELQLSDGGWRVARTNVKDKLCVGR